MNILEVKELKKDYDGFLAVKGVDFNIKKGEIFGFLGPNGAGKTSTINMITGLARPTSGEIITMGKDGIKNIKTLQRKIGIVPDESNLYDDLSGFENLEFCASLYGIRKSERVERAKILLDEFNLSDAGDRPFKKYSKGMKRKLTIAAGIIHKPEILFLDEPTTGIDVKSARQIRNIISDLNKKGATILLTTHYIEEAERLCDRISFIVNGKIIKIGTLKDLMRITQNKNIVQFNIKGGLMDIKEQIESYFRESCLIFVDDKTLKIESESDINIVPFINYFEKQNIHVSEAKIVKPSLEEVFVKITGIEINKMKSEKEKKKK